MPDLSIPPYLGRAKKFTKAMGEGWLAKKYSTPNSDKKVTINNFKSQYTVPKSEMSQK